MTLFRETLGQTRERTLAETSCASLFDFRNDAVTQRVRDARALINAHPEWTDAQDVEAERQHGVRFGPSEKPAVLRNIPLQKLSQFLRSASCEARFSVAGDSMKEPHSSFAR